MRVLGIDEAGRGCVFGDLFIGAFVSEVSDAEALVAAGAGDSKGMSESRRWKAREKLTLLGEWEVRRVPVSAIDEGNLNALEEAVLFDLVRKFQPERVILDALGPPSALPKAIERLRAAVHPLQPEVWWVPKADRDHPVVGAASIFAKTERDAALAELSDAWGALGSGYPSDPVTKSWIRAWRAAGNPWPPFVRTRWGTIRDLGELQLFPAKSESGPGDA